MIFQNKIISHNSVLKHLLSFSFLVLFQTFQLFDRDNNGFVSVKEAVLVLKSLGQDPTEKQVANMMAKIDTNGKKNTECAI